MICGWCGAGLESANKPHTRKDCNKMSELQKLVDWYSGDAENLTMQYTARLAKKELKALQTRLQAIEQAARQLVNELPESEIDLAREVWGNTNANCVLNRKNELAALLKGDK